MLSTIIIFIVFIFFVFLGGMFIVGWKSFKDNNILGGVILMWAMAAIFFLIVFLSGRN